MKYQRWPKRDTDKCYFKMPNEVFCLDLGPKEISIYAYLLRCEDRETYQCHPSYRTIGKAVKMCENTVRKYVLSLEEKGIIRTEPTTITTKDGRIRNGSLLFHPSHSGSAGDLLSAAAHTRRGGSGEGATEKTTGAAQ